MRASRAIGLWAGIILALLVVEVAEITHLFRLPLQSALGNLIAFIFALVFTTLLALIGALFIGIYISQRMQSTGGFTPFEEEMLQMRVELHEVRDALAEIRQEGRRTPPPTPPGGPAAPEAPR